MPRRSTVDLTPPTTADHTQSTTADLTPPTTADHAVVFIGDSHTEIWGLLGLDAINAGISGQKTEEMAARMDADVLSHKPALVHILAGTNDMVTDQPTTAHLIEMSDRAAASGATVIIGTIPPIHGIFSDGVLAWNAEVRSIAASYGYILADYYSVLINEDGSQNQSLFSDSVHLNMAGYTKICGVLREVTPAPWGQFCNQ